MVRLVICGFLLLAGAACSTTPGDAAFQSGHYSQAAELYEAKANLGDPLAAQKLGNLYNHRPGLPEDHQKAIYWYEKAIELGDKASNWMIGSIYRDGKGNVPRNYKMAAKYFMQGAEAGQHYAMYDLADMYAENQIEKPNDVEGLKWMNIVTAYAAKYPKSNEGSQFILRDPKNVRGKLESRMTDQQKLTATQLADYWMSSRE